MASLSSTDHFAVGPGIGPHIGFPNSSLPSVGSMSRSSAIAKGIESSSLGSIV